MVDFSEKIGDFIIFLLKNSFYSQRKTDIIKNLNCVLKKYTFFVSYQKNATQNSLGVSFLHVQVTGNGWISTFQYG